MRSVLFACVLLVLLGLAVANPPPAVKKHLPPPPPTPRPFREGEADESPPPPRRLRDGEDDGDAMTAMSLRSTWMFPRRQRFVRRKS